MRIDINGIACEMPPDVQRKLLDYIQNDLEQRYVRDMDGAMKALTKAFTRKLLLDLERKARKLGGDEAAARFRPPKKSDPNVFLAHVLRDFGEEALKRVCLYISLDESGEGYIVSDLSAGRIDQPNQGQARRSLAGAGHDRIGENDIQQIAGDTTLALISAGEIL